MNETLPKGWVETQISNYCLITMGQSPPGNTYNAEGNGLPFFQGKAEFGKRHPTPKKYCSAPKKTAEKGDILLSVRAPVGPTNICKDISCIGRGLASIRAYQQESQSFVHFYLLSIENWLSKQGAGSTFQAIGKEFIYNLPTPIPPLNEQKRIVAKLDAIIPRIDSVKARLDKVPTLIKRFRQSVLTAAVTGKLTEKWRETHLDVESADDSLSIVPNKLNDSYLNVFEETQHSVLPTTWIYAPLANLGRIQGGGTPSKSNNSYWKGDIPWISPKDMKVDKIYNGRDFISKEAVRNSSAKLIPQNSILFVVRGMILAHTFPVALTQNEVTINQDMKGITPTKQTNPEYLFLVFKNMQNKALSYIKEATHGTLRLEMPLMQTFAVSIPPLSEQKEIVRQVDKLFALADKLETHYQNAKARIDKLSQSILAKAFRGELVPQDPNDEPAEKLLERIMEEKTKMEGALMVARKKTSGKRGKK